MKKILTILLCFALLLILACPITAEVDEYLLIVYFTDSFGNTIAAPLTVKFNETINVSNIPLEVNGYVPYGVSATDVSVTDTYVSNVSITEDGYLAVNDVKENLIVNVNYTFAQELTSVTNAPVSVSYVDNNGAECAVFESSSVYVDANGMMYVLPAVCGEYYPSGLVEVKVMTSQTTAESTPMLFNELEAQDTEASVTTVVDSSSQITDISADVSNTSEIVSDVSTDSADTSEESETTTTIDSAPLPDNTSVSENISIPEDTTFPTETVITTYSAVTPAKKASDIINASYNYTVHYLDISNSDEFGNLITLHSENVDTLSAVVNAVSEYVTESGTYKLCSDFGENSLLSKVSNFEDDATNEVLFYYQLNTSGRLIVTRNSGEDNYKIYTLKLVDGDFLARFALYGNDAVMFDELPEGAYWITDVDASYTYGDSASDVIYVTRDAQAVYEVIDINYLNETESGWFTAQYSTTVTVNSQIAE